MSTTAADNSPSNKNIVKSLLAAVLTPTFVAEVGIGALMPILALSVLAMDGSAAVGAIAVAAFGFGKILGSAVGGVVVAKIGPVRASQLWLLFIAVFAVGAGANRSPWVYVMCAVLMGLGHSGFHVARQAHVRFTVPTRVRARSFSVLAGTWRIANFIGPLLGAFVISTQGIFATYFYIAGLTTAGAVIIGIAAGRVSVTQQSSPETLSTKEVARKTKHYLVTLGSAVLMLGLLRAGRMVALPLWGAHIGLDDHTISLIFAWGSAFDMLLFIPAGMVMDKRGSRWTAIPSTLFLAVGTLMMPFTGGVLTLTIASILLGLGNGWSSGLLMVLAEEIAPVGGRSKFVALWWTLHDTGGLAGPLAVSALAATALSASLIGLGALGVAVTYVWWRWIPSPEETEPTAPETTSPAQQPSQ